MRLSWCTLLSPWEQIPPASVAQSRKHLLTQTISGLQKEAKNPPLFHLYCYKTRSNG